MYMLDRFILDKAIRYNSNHVIQYVLKKEKVIARINAGATGATVRVSDRK